MKVSILPNNLAGILFSLILIGYGKLASQSTDGLIQLIKPNVVTLQTQADDPTILGYGLITGERFGKLYVLTTADLVYQPGPDLEEPEEVFIQLQGMSASVPAILEEIDMLNNLARLKVDKPSGFAWEKACLAILSEANAPVIAFDPNHVGFRSSAAAFDTSLLRITSQNFQDLFCRGSIHPSDYLGIPIMTEEGLAGISVLINSQNWVVKKMSVIEEFMTQRGRFPYTFQLSASEHAKKIHKAYKTSKAPRTFINVRAGWTEAKGDIDPRADYSLERNGLAGTFGIVAGFKWPKRALIGLDINAYGGADYITFSEDASLVVSTSGIGLSLLTGLDLHFGRWQVVPTAQIGYLFFQGQIDFACRIGTEDRCQSQIYIMNEHGLFYGGSLTNYWALTRGARFGLELNYKVFQLNFVQSAPGIMGSLEFSVPFNPNK